MRVVHSHASVTRAVAAWTFGVVLSFVASASADTPKREIPDYDGRGGEPTTAADVALWVPRTLLFPLYLTSEYAVRRPLGALIAGAERSGVPWAIYDLFTFGEANNAGVVPTAFLDFGFEPSVGVYSFWNDAFFEGNDLRFHASTWGADWTAVSATERVHQPERTDQEAVLSASFVRRPDHLFFGLGPESREQDGARYGMDTLEALDIRGPFMSPRKISDSQFAFIYTKGYALT